MILSLLIAGTGILVHMSFITGKKLMLKNLTEKIKPLYNILS